MKYTCNIVINKPIADVVAKFDNAENMKFWMNGLQSFEPISGQPGQVGAVSKLVFLMGKRKMEMIETITDKNLPHLFAGKYEAKGMVNYVANKFESIDNNTTNYITDNEFETKNLMMKLMTWLMPGAFKKQSMKYLTDFKNFVEQAN